jgi:hypothetical protein
MPGVSISTAVRTGPVNTGVAPASTFFVVGETERGTDSVAVMVSSLEEYVSYFGGYEANKYTYQQIRTFFEEGGARAVVARASAADGVAASKALLANPSSAAGITLTAVGKGAWGDDIEVAVVNNDDANFDITVYYGGTELVNLVAQTSGHTSLTSAIEAINNSSAFAKYCTASLTTGASPTALLADLAVTNFTSGDDGDIAEDDFLEALNMFSEDLGAGAVSIPGLADGSGDSSIWNAIKSHCETNNRIGILSFHSDATVAEVVSASESYGAGDNSDHEYLAMYHPWVKIPSGSGTSLTIPPDAYVAAKRSKAHNGVGTWQPFAGVSSEGAFVTGIASGVSRTQALDLDNARVNALRVINNTVRIYGARSHSTNTTQWRFITHRDTINYIVDRCENALEPLIFSTINGRRTIYLDISSALKGVMEPIRAAGGLYEGFDANGKQVDFGYTIKVDDSINPVSQLESGLVKAQLGVRVSSVGDKIEVNLIKSNLTATLV